MNQFQFNEVVQVDLTCHNLVLNIPGAVGVNPVAGVPADAGVFGAGNLGGVGGGGPGGGGGAAGFVPGLQWSTIALLFCAHNLVLNIQNMGVPVGGGPEGPGVPGGEIGGGPGGPFGGGVGAANEGGPEGPNGGGPEQGPLWQPDDIGMFLKDQEPNL